MAARQLTMRGEVSTKNKAPTSVAARPRLARSAARAIYPLQDQLCRVASYVTRRWNRTRSRALSKLILQSLDHEAFDSIYRKYAAYFRPTPYSKYLNVRHWIIDSAQRFYLHKFDRLPPGRKFLDLGSGGGFFLVVCRHFGHQVQGLDIDAWPIFNDLIEFFGIKRIEHRIEPGVPLPDFSQRFDVVTAFMTGFDKTAAGIAWDENQWIPFLTDLRQYVVDGGIVVIKFIKSKKTGEYYGQAARWAIQNMPQFEARFCRDVVRLVAV